MPPQLCPLPRRRVSVCASKGGKGFSSAPKPSKKAGDGGAAKPKKAKRRKSKGKGGMRVSVDSTPAQKPQPPAGLGGPGLGAPIAPTGSDMPGEAPADDDDFDARLAELQETARLLKKEKAANTAAATDPNRDIYSNPPPLTSTVTAVFEKGSSSAPVAPEESGGTNRVGLAVGAVILALIVGFTSGDTGGGGGGTRTASGGADLAPEAKEQLQKVLGDAQARVNAKADDTEALETAAVAAANLQDFKGAQASLEQLVKYRADDAEAWRLLAETRAANKETGKSTEAYARALQLVGGATKDLDVFKGYVSSLVADSKPEKAVEVTKAAVKAAEEARGAVSPYEMRLLLAKVYSSWPGHTPDAAAVYDQLIGESPEDFRAYLAKGLLLRDAGQKGNAERMFLQARFYAPKDARGVVDRIIAK